MAKGGFNKISTAGKKPKFIINQADQGKQAQQAQAEQVKVQAEQVQQAQAEQVKVQAEQAQAEEVQPEAEAPQAEEVQPEEAKVTEGAESTEATAEGSKETQAEEKSEEKSEAKAEEVKPEPVKPFLTYSARDFSTAVHKELPELLKKLRTEEFSEKELRRLHKEGFTFLQRFNDGVCSTLSMGNERVLRAISLYKERLEELPKQLERATRDTETAGRFANEKLVKGPIKNLVETLNLSLEKLPKNSEDANFVDFLAKLKDLDNDLRENLAKHQIFIFGKIGETFDVNLHEAIAQYPAPSDDQKGKIAYVSNEGFKIEDRVIEPAKVVVYLED